MPTEEPTRKGSRRAAWIAGGWALAIFATSCTFIPAPTFIRFVQSLSRNPTFQAGFAYFWMHDGFFVVKGWHATEYAILVFFCSRMLRRQTGWSVYTAVGVAFAFAVVYAASDEWHQTFVPGRDGNARDVLIDTAGALTAVVWLTVREHRRRAAEGRKSI